MTGNIPQGNATYDTATANMEAPWKMPTKAQCSELINTNNTTRTWTTINGVNGWKFTNKSDSNKYIFLPAGGYWDRSSHDNAGSGGYYWYTTWRSSDQAYIIYFNSSNINTGYIDRFYGISIRGVQ